MKTPLMSASGSPSPAINSGFTYRASLSTALSIFAALFLSATSFASQSDESRLREIITELRAINAEDAKTRETLAHDLAEASSALATAQAQSETLAQQATQNAAAADGWRKQANTMLLRAQEAEEKLGRVSTSLWRWRGIAAALVLSAGLYVAARLHPLIRGFVP